MHISLAAFLTESVDGEAANSVSRQEIERSILQQMLYGADANRLPFSRFKRIQSPGRWAALFSLCIVLGMLACWHLFQERAEIITGAYFKPFAFSNWLNLACFAVGSSFLWLTVHRLYVASFRVTLKSISLKDIQITPEAASEESILNRHLDEIIYFFQSTEYDLVVIEDLDRFDKADIFVTLREINSLVNANSDVKRAVRFLYAIRDNMFVNTDRTKFFEFIVPVIPIINSSNSIDMVLKQGKRLAIDERLDGQFLREVSRYLNDLRLIQNIFNEYAIYVANLETDGENVLNPNKLLAVLIYKNVFPSDFENLHRGKGGLAQILDLHDELIAKGEAGLKAEISRLDEQIANGAMQLPADLGELRRSYAMALIEKLPASVTHVGLNGQSLVALPSLSNHESFEQVIQAQQLSYQTAQGYQQRIDVSGLQAEVDPLKTYQQRKEGVEFKSEESRAAASRNIRDLRAKLSTLRLAKFNEIIRQNSVGMEALFEDFGDHVELARFLVLEGFLDDTYYQYTSLFHSGRLSPNDNKFLIQIRAFVNPEPDFQIDNPSEVIAAMRNEDFGQIYVLNVKIADCLLGDPSQYHAHAAKMYEFIASDYQRCEEFFSVYYTTGSQVSALLSGLVSAWPGYISAVLASSRSYEHVARIIAHLSNSELATLRRKHTALSVFVSENLPQIMALGVDFEPQKLKILEIEATELSGIEDYPGVARLLVEEGLYKISIDNVDFAFRVLLGVGDRAILQTQNYTAILEAGNDALSAKINRDFEPYLRNVLLALPENSLEGVPAMLATINREELDTEDLKSFLEKQAALIPSLDQVPARLHTMVFELSKIEPSWENCLAFLTGDNHDAGVLTDYLDRTATVAALSKVPLSDTDLAFPLRQFLIGNDALSDASYRQYMRSLPKEFKKLPEGISREKQRIVIEERRASFTPENLAILSDEGDLHLLFVAKNVDLYLKRASEFHLDDEFREKLLSYDIDDTSRLSIIREMDLTSLAGVPSRAAKVGEFIARTGAEIGEIGAESAQAIVTNSKPTSVQISLLNKFQKKLDDQQIKVILGSMAEPISEIKPGYGTPRIKSTEENIEFVKWLEIRRFISSWKKGGWLDDDIRINLFRK